MNYIIMQNKLICLIFIFILCSCSISNNQVFDPILQKNLQISGIVIKGDYQTPEGLLGGPRVFLYQILLDTGEEINLTYTVYPPSPATDTQPQPQLEFFGDTINPGDRIVARGTYNPETNTLIVEQEEDYIRMYPGSPVDERLSPGSQTIRGIVLDGGDQTPEGLLGGPRVFLYQVLLDTGEEINLTYTAYPPSPTTDTQPQPQLEFFGGTINPGDRIVARGTYNPETNTLIVEQEEDYIRTYPGSPVDELLSPGTQTINGIVLDGGDQTPEGLLGGPRVFLYQVLLDTGEEINLSYTAYPPSPTTDTQPQPQLEFFGGTINPGDRIVAKGTYNPETNTLVVENDTDFIQTFRD